MDNHENEILDTAPETGAEPEQAPVESQEPAAAQVPVVEQNPVVQDTQQVEAAAFVQETEIREPEIQTAEHNVETVRKESPFADSPYVMEHQNTVYTPGYTIPSTREPMPKRRKKVRKLWNRIAAAVLILALVGGSCGVTAMLVNNYWEGRTEALNDELQRKMNLLEQQLDARIDKVEHDGTSVSGSPVNVEGLTPGQVYVQNVDSTVLVYSEVRNMGQSGYSTGSGFILTQDGYVVTNYHVIEGGTSYLVVTSDNVQHKATLVGGDATNDVAVLKMEEGEYPAVTVGSSDALIVGDQVVAIGNPLGELTSTLTVGYISAKGRYVTTESTTINMLQTDCAINSGNSGGPLFNMKGEVVGITSAKYSGTSSSGASIEGIGFAIPIDDVLGLIEDVIEFGYVNSAYLGVEVNNQNEITAGLPAGAYVVTVTPGYCAEAAGIRAGDYIIELDGHEIGNMNDLTRILRRLDPGTTTTVKVLRGTVEITLEITLDARPRDTDPNTPAEQMPLPDEGNFDEWYEYFRWFFENQERP